MQRSATGVGQFGCVLSFWLINRFLRRLGLLGRLSQLSFQMDDFIFTLESEPEDAAPVSKSSKVRKVSSRKTTTRKDNDTAEPILEMNPKLLLDGLGFDFDPSDTLSNKRIHQGQQVEDPIEKFKKKNALPRVQLDEIIARHKKSTDLSAQHEVELEDWSGQEMEDSDLEEKLASSHGSQDEDLVDQSEASVTSGHEENEEDVDQDHKDSKTSHSPYNSSSESEQDPEPVETLAEGHTSVNNFFDSSTLPFDAATKEELAKDGHDQPFASLPGSATVSRPLLLGLSSMSITTPTPIQRQTIPLGLLGKDLVCSSVTGSGKTLGYLVPILERLMWRDKKGGGRTRVLILSPTRELAVQVFQVGKLVARYTDLTFSLCVGGMNLRIQEAELRERPEIVIGTPGRVIDHVRNTQGFSLEALEILVIDEADRILEEGFRDELEEIISQCPRSRQTMLFSATVNESVADLARLSLDKPIRVKIDPPKSTAAGLTQEFLRVRDNPNQKNSDALSDLTRQAILISLCKTSAFSKGKAIIFFRSKAGAHRMKVIFSLFSLKAEELHGDLTQEQRLLSLQKFKDGQTSYLLATDLASRGLDIKGVERVINYESPKQYEVYLHRIGRTARAGNKGSALTLVGESDRKLIREARKNTLAGQSALKQRRIDPKIVSDVRKELEKLTSTISAILQEEREEKELRKSEMVLRKGENLIEHSEEIKSRPARTWFQSELDKKKAKHLGTSAHTAAFTSTPSVQQAKKGPQRDRFDGLSRKAKRRKMAKEEDAKEKLQPAIKSSIRAAKKAQRPIKINATQAAQDTYNHQNKKVKKVKKSKKPKSSFDLDMGAKARSLGQLSFKKQAKKPPSKPFQAGKSKK
ncbi:hypothetical protein O181_006632 [Austropuccinia psidii MF-1]|uniref:RNA helicase n=1 Tax=Austropuccinia psidii MF-1 TaxID=1389203 RepID=A0A9Q3GHS1_9BASI|nr:hypothetical protein [Austropuccinia psidii MF-1]